MSTNGSSKSGTSKASQFGWLDTSSIVSSVGYQNAVKMIDAAHKFAVQQANLNAYIDKQIEPALVMLKQATAMDASPALKAYDLAVKASADHSRLLVDFNGINDALKFVTPSPLG